MEVLTPRSLDEALALKAERPEAVPIQGSTDVMVELNFDRGRPPALLNLNEVTELRRRPRSCSAEPERGAGAPRPLARERGDPARFRPDLHRGDGSRGAAARARR